MGKCVQQIHCSDKIHIIMTGMIAKGIDLMKAYERNIPFIYSVSFIVNTPANGFHCLNGMPIFCDCKEPYLHLLSDNILLRMNEWMHLANEMVSLQKVISQNGKHKEINKNNPNAQR